MEPGDTRDVEKTEYQPDLWPETAKLEEWGEAEELEEIEEWESSERPEGSWESEEGGEPEEAWELEEGGEPGEAWELEEGGELEEPWELEEGEEPEEAWESEEGGEPEEAWESEEGGEPDDSEGSGNTEEPEDLKDAEGADADEDRTRNPWGIMAVLALLFFAVLGIVLTYRFMYQVEPVFSQTTYELGDQISTDLDDYLKGSDWSVGLGELDLSGVDQKSAGTYEAVVRHGRERYLYQITIEDTVPPRILLPEDPVYLAVNRRYSVEDVIDGVQDEDPDVQLLFVDGERSRNVILYEETGSFSCVVTAQDSSGNQSQAVLWVTVDTPPEISGVQDIYLTVGSQVDYLEHVTATARREGNLTDKIVVDDAGVDLAKEGIYWLSYQVEDSRGIDETCEAKVVVASAADLQEMIGRRQINRNSHRIIGAWNLYDGGASIQDDIGDTLEYMRPAFVQLYHRSDTGYSSGSGYIMEITDDQIFICSNRHVVEKYDTWEVYFHDGTRAEGKSVGTSTGYDVGVVVLPREEVPEELLAGLMTVHIDKEYWEGLDDQKIELGLERVDRQGGILHATTGNLVKIKQEFDWNDRKEQTEVTVKLEHGDSGSAVVDGHGNLICMAFAYSEDPLRYWCVPLDGILEGYETITGRTVYVY